MWNGVSRCGPGTNNRGPGANRGPSLEPAALDSELFNEAKQALKDAFSLVFRGGKALLGCWFRGWLGKHHQCFSVLGDKLVSLSYSTNLLVSIPSPEANNLQTIRSLSAPLQMGRMKREMLLPFCVDSRPTPSECPESLFGWHDLGSFKTPP